MSGAGTALVAQRTVPTSLGPLLLARTGTGLAGAWFAQQKYHPGELDVPWRPDDALLAEGARQLLRYFDGGAATFDLPLDLIGTPFQRRVWDALLAITAGTTCSYGELARRIGAPTAVRAVAAAVGRNPLSVLVPCHRVLGHDGGLTGYAGGLDRKVALLRLEGAWPPASNDVAAALDLNRVLF